MDQNQNSIALLFEEEKEEVKLKQNTHEVELSSNLLHKNLNKIWENATELFKENETAKRQFLKEVQKHMQLIFSRELEDIDYEKEVKEIWERIGRKKIPNHNRIR